MVPHFVVSINKGTMKKKKRRLHPLEIAARNASFDILGYIQKKFKEAITKHENNPITIR